MRFVATALALLIPWVAQAQDYGTYHALVIGNDDYRHVSKLKTAVADARAVSALLREAYGYRVTRLENASRRQIVSALGSYRRTLGPSDNLLVYYAGHGYLDADVGEGYWFPIDARPDDEADWISNATITTRLKALSAKHVMVVSDSCYSGSLTRGLTVRVRDRATLAGKRARVVLTSGGIEPVEDGGGGKHSVFAKAFLGALRGNARVLDGQELFKAIKPAVMVGSDQQPDYGTIRKAGHDGGEFFFVRSQAAGPPIVTPSRKVNPLLPGSLAHVRVGQRYHYTSTWRGVVVMTLERVYEVTEVTPERVAFVATEAVTKAGKTEHKPPVTRTWTVQDQIKQRATYFKYKWTTERIEAAGREWVCQVGSTLLMGQRVAYPLAEPGTLFWPPLISQKTAFSETELVRVEEPAGSRN